jgi:hypothetical protein
MAQGFQVRKPKQSRAKKSKGHAYDYRREIEAYWEQERQENSEHYISAWQAGVYNPLGPSAETSARPLEADEAEWLFLAKEVGRLQVEEELDAIYFTAPPPNFDLNQADWYIRPDLATWLEEPELLRETIAKYPIPAHLMAMAIERYTKPLGWDAEKVEAFVQEYTDPPASERLSRTAQPS